MAQNSTNTTEVDWCHLLRQEIFKDNFLSLIALGIVVFMSFLERRRSFRKDICFGCPGALVPINLINGDKYVLSHSAAFGCTVGSVFFTFLDSVSGTDIDYGDAWLNSFAVFFNMMLLGLQYYPLFVCVEYGSSNLYAPVIGLLYTLLLSIVHIAYVTVCYDLLIFLILLPVNLCILYLVVMFTRNIVLALLRLIRRKPAANYDENHRFSPSKNHQYVRILFSPKTEVESQATGESLTVKIRDNVSKRKACLQTEIIQRSSNRIASIFVVSGVLLYQWFVFCVKLSQGFQNQSISLKQSTNQITFLSNYTTLISRSLDAFIGSCYAATFAAGIIVIANMYMIYTSHRRHISRLLMGNKAFIPKKCWDMKPSVILAKNINYPGFQIGHLVWGFLLNFIVMLVICLLLSFFLIMPIVYPVPDAFYSLIRTLLPPFSVTLVFYLSIVKVSGMFLQSEIKEIDGEPKLRKMLALTNWRAYQNFSYFMFFFYIFVGIFGCLRRILVSVAIGFYYLARLDKCILTRNLEHFDTSYMSYVAFLRVQVSHSNPVVTTFCELLLSHINDAKSDKEKPMTTLPVENGEKNSIKKNSIERRRWFKAVTLLRNPDLISESKPRLSEKTDKTKNIEDDKISDENAE